MDKEILSISIFIADNFHHLFTKDFPKNLWQSLSFSRISFPADIVAVPHQSHQCSPIV